MFHFSKVKKKLKTFNELKSVLKILKIIIINILNVKLRLFVESTVDYPTQFFVCLLRLTKELNIYKNVMDDLKIYGEKIDSSDCRCSFLAL